MPLLAPFLSFALTWLYWRCGRPTRPFWAWFRRYGLYPWAILTAFWVARWG